MPRLNADPELQWEADKSGVIHVRKHPGETEVLPGYGITEFGMSSYKPKSRFSTDRVLLGAGLGTLGIIAWRLKDTLMNYALLRIEESRSEAG